MLLKWLCYDELLLSLSVEVVGTTHQDFMPLTYPFTSKALTENTVLKFYSNRSGCLCMLPVVFTLIMDSG